MTGPTQFPRPYIAMRKQGQRRKDHGARRREAEWRAYQALWQKPIDKLRTPSGDDFYSLRRNILMLNRKQCARLLRCGVQSVLNWETGRHPVPFYAYLALLLTSESVHYRLASDAWKDWDFIERLPENAFDRPKRGGSRYITEMVNRKTGAHFTPDELCRYHMQIQQLRMLESQVRELHEKVSALTQENTEIRELFRVNGVTDEMHAMQDRLSDLLGKINTAGILQMPKGRAAGERGPALLASSAGR